MLYTYVVLCVIDIFFVFIEFKIIYIDVKYDFRRGYVPIAPTYSGKTALLGFGIKKK